MMTKRKITSALAGITILTTVITSGFTSRQTNYGRTNGNISQPNQHGSCPGNTHNHHANGSMVGYTNSVPDGPGDCTSCHGGGSATPVFSFTGTPAFTGNTYVPGTVYTIAIKVTGTGYTKFGFDLEMLNGQLSTSVAAGSAYTAVTNSRITAASTYPINISQTSAIATTSTATFKWTAPASGSVYVYGDGLGCNGDGSTNGDNVVLYTLTLTPATTGTPPVANFTASTSTVCAGQAITMTDNSTNTPTSWSWTTTGGSPATASSQSPSITYNTAGTYTVTLASTNSSGASTPISHTVTVNAAPSVPTINLTGSTLTSSSTTGNQWYKNGTLISGATNQAYTATANGAYTVTVSNSFGCTSTSAATNYSTVSAPPVANFAASTTECAGQAITMTDNSSNTPTSWNWTTTGGTPTTSSSQSPSITYSTAGTFTVTLIATNSSGTSSPISHTITVNANPPIPTITSSTNSFSSSSTTGNQWNLNGVAISGATNQTYTPTVTGSYTVVISNSFGCTSTSAASTYTNNNAPVANFAASIPSVCAGQSIPLTDNSTNGPTSWNWTLTGGTPASSSSQSPSVSYSTAGTYTVTLVASNANGASAPVSHTVTINASPSVPTITIAGITLSSSAFTGNQWYLNGALINGATSQSQAATTDGLYTVVVTNSSGCSSTSAATNYTTAGISTVADNTMINVFPNPSNGIVNINFAGKNDHVTIEVMNNIGQLVYTEKVSDCTNDCNKIIDMSSFKKGIYLFRIMSDGNIHTKKVLLVD